MFGWGNDVLACRCHQMVNPMTNTTLMELSHSFARPKGVSTPPCQEGGQAGVFLPDVEYSHLHEEGPLPLAERRLYTLIAPNEMITRTRGKPELDDSQGVRMCTQNGRWTVRNGQPFTWTVIDSIVQLVVSYRGVDHKRCPAQNMDCDRQYCPISCITWFGSIHHIIWFLPFVLIYHYIHLGM